MKEGDFILSNQQLQNWGITLEPPAAGYTINESPSSPSPTEQDVEISSESSLETEQDLSHQCNDGADDDEVDISITSGSRRKSIILPAVEVIDYNITIDEEDLGGENGNFEKENKDPNNKRGQRKGRQFLKKSPFIAHWYCVW